jgi:hypothetical protein
VLAEYIGPHKIMWATDYPRQDGFFPGAPDMLREPLKGSRVCWPAVLWHFTR